MTESPLFGHLLPVSLCKARATTDLVCLPNNFICQKAEELGRKWLLWSKFLSVKNELVGDVKMTRISGELVYVLIELPKLFI